MKTIIPWSKSDIENLKAAVAKSKNPNWNTIANQLGRTRKGVSTKASREGFVTRSKQKPHPWTVEQEESLLSLVELGRYTLPEIVTRYNRVCRENGWPVRSTSSLRAKAMKQGYNFDRRDLGEFLTVRNISTGLGHKTDAACLGWIRAKLLPSVGGTCPRDPYRIKCKDFVVFALENPAKIWGYSKADPDGCAWLLMLIRDEFPRKFLKNAKNKKYSE